MKKFTKMFLSLALTLCLLAVPFSTALAETAPLDLMPASDAGYTIVAGDGTVSIDNGTMTIVNNGDGDLRVTIDSTTEFDLAALHTLHMDFNAEMPFKMAYHIVSKADNTSSWLNTSTDFTDLYEVDAAADRAAAGEYDVSMNLSDRAATMTDKSSVYFEQFIILLTGKGTFTLNTVEMTDGTTTGSAGDSSTDDATTTAAKTTAADKDADSKETGDATQAVTFAVVAMAAVAVVTLSVVASKKAKAR